LKRNRIAIDRAARITSFVAIPVPQGFPQMPDDHFRDIIGMTESIATCRAQKIFVALPKTEFVPDVQSQAAAFVGCFLCL